MFEERFCPFTDESKGEHLAIVGLIVNHNDSYNEMGIASRIDRSYKDKDDDVSDFIVKWHGEEDEFRKLCEDLDIGLMEYSV